MTTNKSGFTGQRWLVVSGEGQLEQYAATQVSAIIQQHVPYVLQVFAGGCDTGRLRRHNLVVVGTPQSSELIADLVKQRKIKLAKTRRQSYAIAVLPSPYNAKRQMLVLAGSDEQGVLWAVRDWEHYCYDPYVSKLSRQYQPLPNVPKNLPTLKIPFLQPLPEWKSSSSPAVANRGLWTWGHVVYDYRAYLENMSRWKMNTIIIWNDYAPLNAKEIVDFAHLLGIRVIWGYSWGWEVIAGHKIKLDSTDPATIKRWKQKIIRTYEEQYLPTGADGIYFQTFTETEVQKIGGKPIAKLATDWVNKIADTMLQRYPDLWIQFGLHAISIRDNIHYIKDVDKRINITWEDAGGFPYLYDVYDNSTLGETIDYTHKLARLRGSGEDVGLVLKGMPTLNWMTFENQLGPFVMGQADRDFIRRRAELIEPRWKYFESGWRKNLSSLCRVVRTAVAAQPEKLIITGVVEDAMWEHRMYLPPCLLAEVMWNPAEKPDELLTKVAATRDAHCLS